MDAGADSRILYTETEQEFSPGAEICSKTAIIKKNTKE